MSLRSYKKPTAIDLYSGVGGWSLGLKMAGFRVLRSYEWWDAAVETHRKNFPRHAKQEPADIRKMLPEIGLPKPKEVDFVVGSPPCTQFSYSNRGGSGDIADGLRDIACFLDAVEYLRPKYWVMENVPRVAKVLEHELKEGGSLEQYRHLFGSTPNLFDSVPMIEVIDISQYGLPQSRKRMFAGNFPREILESYRGRCEKRTLGDVLKALKQQTVIDPIWGISLPKHEVTGLETEIPLNKEEVRMNSDSKRHHPVYNQMQFPDSMERPARTVTATCTRVSRESIIVEDGKDQYRRLSVRERATLQSFPITYEFYGSSYSSRLKMIGNALPPVMAYFLGMAMREVNASRLKLPEQRANQHRAPRKKASAVQIEKEGTTYPKNRTFRAALPYLRLASGTRFELKNDFAKDEVTWRVDFYFGTSKDIRHKKLDDGLFNRLMETFDEKSAQRIRSLFVRYEKTHPIPAENDLQAVWNRTNRKGKGPFELADSLGDLAEKIISEVEKHDQALIEKAVAYSLKTEIETLNGGWKKLIENSNRIFSGMLLGAWINSVKRP